MVSWQFSVPGQAGASGFLPHPSPLGPPASAGRHTPLFHYSITLPCLSDGYRVKQIQLEGFQVSSFKRKAGQSRSSRPSLPTSNLTLQAPARPPARLSVQTNPISGWHKMRLSSVATNGYRSLDGLAGPAKQSQFRKQFQV